MGYNHQYPPEQIQKKGKNKIYLPSEVFTTIELEDIIEISEASSIISLKFTASFQWTDSRIKFDFLKQDSNKNMVGNSRGNIWTPEPIFSMLKDQSKPIKTYERITIERKGKPTMSALMDDLQANETYEGGENPITIRAVYQGDFICSFEGITRYPFDSQQCDIHIFISDSETNLTRLIPASLSDRGPSAVGQFQVMGWTFIPANIHGKVKQKYQQNFIHHKVEHKVQFVPFFGLANIKRCILSTLEQHVFLFHPT